MRKLTCSTFAVLLLCSGLCAAEASLNSLLPPGMFERLLQEGEIRNSLNEDSPPQLVPGVPAQGEIERRVREMELRVGTELLMLYRADSVDFESPDSQLKIYNILRSISTMEGIQYYSASRQRMRTLFARSYAVEGPDSPQPIPDPLVRDIPPFSKLYIFQEDLTFGENMYVSEYYYPGGYFLMDIRNLTSMRYLFFRMAKPGDCLTLMLLIPVGDRILFYGVVGAHTGRLLGLERSKEDSFYNRLKAMYGWFAKSMEEAF